MCIYNWYMSTGIRQPFYGDIMVNMYSQQIWLHVCPTKNAYILMPHGYFDRESHKKTTGFSTQGTETNWNHQPMTTKTTNIYLKTVSVFDCTLTKHMIIWVCSHISSSFSLFKTAVFRYCQFFDRRISILRVLQCTVCFFASVKQLRLQCLTGLSCCSRPWTCPWTTLVWAPPQTLKK